MIGMGKLITINLQSSIRQAHPPVNPGLYGVARGTTLRSTSAQQSVSVMIQIIQTSALAFVVRIHRHSPLAGIFRFNIIPCRLVKAADSCRTKNRWDQASISSSIYRCAQEMPEMPGRSDIRVVSPD